MQTENAYRIAQNLFERFGEHRDDVAAVSGLILGMVATGVKVDDKEFSTVPTLAFGVEPEELSSDMLDWIRQYGKDNVQALLEGVGFNLLLPPDSALMSLRVAALKETAESLLVGIGVKVKNFKDFSTEVQSMIDDLVEITKLDCEAEDSNANESSFIVLEEYIKTVVQIIFEECGAKAYPKDPGMFVLEDDIPGLTKLSAERMAAHEKEVTYWEQLAKQGTGRDKR